MPVLQCIYTHNLVKRKHNIHENIWRTTAVSYTSILNRCACLPSSQICTVVLPSFSSSNHSSAPSSHFQQSQQLPQSNQYSVIPTVITGMAPVSLQNLEQFPPVLITVPLFLRSSSCPTVNTVVPTLSYSSHSNALLSQYTKQWPPFYHGFTLGIFLSQELTSGFPLSQLPQQGAIFLERESDISCYALFVAIRSVLDIVESTICSVCHVRNLQQTNCQKNSALQGRLPKDWKKYTWDLRGYELQVQHHSGNVNQAVALQLSVNCGELVKTIRKPKSQKWIFISDSAFSLTKERVLL